jgi:predicted amidohydrolase
MSRVVEVVALQLEAVPGDRDHNLERFERAVREECGGADLIVTPELLNVGYDLDWIGRNPDGLAESLDGPTVTLARNLANECGATIVIGLLERDGERLHDSAAIVDANGAVATYRKSHLYPPERASFAPGDRLLLVPTSSGRLGVMICFEHAFPEIATALALEGAQILTIPSAVPFGYEHLLTLRTRARAQDNQLFVVACNLAGNGFCGGSLIVDPRGEVLARAGIGEETIRATIDLETIEREREREPALRLRRPALYR